VNLVGEGEKKVQRAGRRYAGSCRARLRADHSFPRTRDSGLLLQEAAGGVWGDV
jgi:hypothetical protein